MRGTILVTGSGTPLEMDSQPHYLKLGIDIDSPQPAEFLPLKMISVNRGKQFEKLLPKYAVERETYFSTSPAKLWLRLRNDQFLSD